MVYPRRIIFVTYDDDDWHSPERVYRRVGPMVDTKATLTGTSKIYYHSCVSFWVLVAILGEVTFVIVVNSTRCGGRRV